MPHCKYSCFLACVPSKGIIIYFKTYRLLSNSSTMLILISNSPWVDLLYLKFAIIKLYPWAHNIPMVVSIHKFFLCAVLLFVISLVSRCRFESRNVTGRAPLGVSIAARGLMHCNTSTSKHGETSISMLCAEEYVHVWCGYRMCSNLVILLSNVNYIIELKCSKIHNHLSGLSLCASPD